MNAQFEESEPDAGGGLRPELVKSYVNFGLRAVRRRRVLAGATFTTVALLVLGGLSVWPKTYHSETSLMVQRNQVAFQDARQDALDGATDTIFRRENVEEVAREANLVQHAARGRSPAIKLKEFVMTAIRGERSPDEHLRMVVGSLQGALGVNVSNGTLTISVDWSDAESAAEIVEAAQHRFLQSRHVAEISTLAEYIAVLEEHAGRVRKEIDDFAQQAQRLRENKLAQVETEAAAVRSRSDARSAPVAAPRRAVSTPAGPDEELASIQSEIELKERSASELESQRERRLTELQGRLTELQSKYTGAHPLVVDLRTQIAAFSAPSEQASALRKAVAGLKSQLKQRTQPDATSLPAAASGGGLNKPPSAEPLPPEFIQLMQETGDQLDPAVGAQLRGAIEKYSGLRTKISTARLDLDTAQVAFRHRYQVIVPAEVADKPIKPKAPLVIGAGLAAALLLALALCIVGELRTGLLVERWQVEQVGIPVLGELPAPRNVID